MSFALRHGRGGSHQFEKQEGNGSTWASLGLCHKCSRPFIGAWTQTPVCCRACNFVACQGCASNQADWESKYRCASAKASVISYQGLEDIGETQDRSRVLPPSVQEHRKQLMARHDQLLDCIRELRATTHKYREEVCHFVAPRFPLLLPLFSCLFACPSHPCTFLDHAPLSFDARQQLTVCAILGGGGHARMLR